MSFSIPDERVRDEVRHLVVRLAGTAERHAGADMLASGDREAICRALAPALGIGATRTCQTWLARLPHRPGTWWHGCATDAGPAWLKLTLLDDGNEQCHALLTMDGARDEAALAEQLAAARLDAMITTAGALCHTVNNALTALLGNAEMLLETEGLPEDAKASAELVLRAGERLDGLTSRTLRLGRARHPGPGRSFPHISLGRAVMAIRQSGQPEVTMAVPDGLGVLLTEAGAFEEAAAHLLRNAMVAAGPGGRVFLSARREARAAWPGFAWLCVTVEDDGPGLPASELAFPGGGFLATGRSGGGHPLGLACVRAFATALGGTLEAATGAGGRGAAVTLRLPIRDLRA
jgi:signal transduction histidine kinase